MDSNIKQLNNLIKEKRDDRKERIKADIELYGHEVHGHQRPDLLRSPQAAHQGKHSCSCHRRALS